MMKKQTNKQVLIFCSESFTDTNSHYCCFNITLSGQGVTESFPHRNKHALRQILFIYNNRKTKIGILIYDYYG